MRRFFDWQIVVALVLVVLSIVFYSLHYLVFRDLHHIFIYLIGDVAFLFLDVLIVVLVLHRLLAFREKKQLNKKLNVIIGVFFSEAGNELLRKMSEIDQDLPEIRRALVVTNEWSEKEYRHARVIIGRHQGRLDGRKANLEQIRAFLAEKRDFLLRLLENPNLLDHESFTNLLWAIFHLTEELAHRRDLNKLPDQDRQHLIGDLQRAYRQLIGQWLDYIKYLGRDYPYLFSLALRTNPFDDNASIEIK